MTVFIERRAGDGAARQGPVAGREGGDGEEARGPHDLLQPAGVRHAKAGKFGRGFNPTLSVAASHVLKQFGVCNLDNHAVW